jgi:hypothetical protein
VGVGPWGFCRMRAQIGVRVGVAAGHRLVACSMAGRSPHNNKQIGGGEASNGGHLSLRLAVLLIKLLSVAV